ncbi:MAG: thymidine phosphorylase [Candidatus Methanomethylophilaceae archaeon]|nr:thymidine phosphorylase [Candidatus Methanomethylophilaceae archaeon]
MRLIAIDSDMAMSEPIVLMNSDDCLKLGVGPDDRVRLTGEGAAVSAVVVTDSVERGTVRMPAAVMEKCSVKVGGEVEVLFSPQPESIRSIRKKINGGRLDMDEIGSIVSDIMAGGLSDKEVIAFVSSFNVNNSDLSEVAYLTRSMAATGETVDFGVRPVFDFHSLGGVPGNKITPIVVSIVASEGLTIPKLSSRAVSSACGTSDYVDTFCDVEMDARSLAKAVAEVGGVFACGNEDYAPVGSKIIRAERPMGIDPWPTMMASIMSKKVALGTTHLLMDIPMGEGSKVPDMETAKSFSDGIIDLGTILGIHVECAITRAEEPIGRAIGPILEAKECIEALENRGGDPTVVDKACGLAGIILEMAGDRDGKERALDIFRSGRAHEKFLEIVEAQGGSRSLSSQDLVPGSFWKDVHAKRAGFVQEIDNAGLVAIAKGAGAPADVGAGVFLLHKKGDRVDEGEVLFRIYAESKGKLDRAVESARSRRPMKVLEVRADPVPEDMVVRRIPSKEMLDLIRFRVKRRWRMPRRRQPFVLLPTGGSIGDLQTPCGRRLRAAGP